MCQAVYICDQILECPSLPDHWALIAPCTDDCCSSKHHPFEVSANEQVESEANWSTGNLTEVNAILCRSRGQRHVVTLSTVRISPPLTIYIYAIVVVMFLFISI